MMYSMLVIYLPLNFPTDKGEKVISHVDFLDDSKINSLGPERYSPLTITYMISAKGIQWTRMLIVP